MKRLLNAALLTALVGSTTAVMAPSAIAATGRAAAEPGCVTESGSITGARGEITICVQNGTARVTGNLVDTLPGSGFGEPDGYCASWWIDWATTTGSQASHEILVCGQWGADEKTFDYDPAAGEGGVKGITGLNLVKLGRASL
ncbi:hypothetical protein ACFWZ2_39555 [Streptomyces sp. NPDC059002]|uniref:hypothetical protein n=1 Tax=Streptomyces sp. NPDC059002 TaxID=3346690 RepID=UPI0036846BFF